MEVRLRPVVGFENYRVGDDGSVWTQRNLQGHLTSNWRTLKQKVVEGYLAVVLTEFGKQHLLLVHKLVLDAFVGPRPDKMEARHGVEGKLDNTLSNLRWGTHKENMNDKKRDGTECWGELNYSARLTELIVRIIRRDYKRGVSCAALAKRYGVHWGTIKCIVERRTWKHIA